MTARKSKNPARRGRAEEGCSQIEHRPRLHKKLTAMLESADSDCLIITDYGTTIQFLVQKVKVLS